MEVRRGQRTILPGASEPLSCDSQSSSLTASLVPLGDGILMIRKNTETVAPCQILALLGKFKVFSLILGKIEEV